MLRYEEQELNNKQNSLMYNRGSSVYSCNRLLLLHPQHHSESSISAVAAAPDVCDPAFTTKRSLLPNTSATTGKQ